MTGPLDEDRLDRDLLAAYRVPAMPPDLADRFVERLSAAGRAPAPRRRSLRGPAVAIGLLAAGVALGLLVGRPGRAEEAARGADRGSLAADGRRQVRLADRAVAVAEAGAELSWRSAGGALAVEQRRGEVFYRVDPGGPVAVDTPAGQVRVTGTCFRVIVTAPEGGAGKPAVSVAVDEGAVVLAAGGAELALGPGERGVAGGDAGPAPAPREGPRALDGRDTAGSGRADELARRVAALEEEVRRLRRPDHDPATRRPVDLGREELLALARRCEVPFDLPPTRGSSVMDQILAQGFDEVGLTEAERRAVERVIARTQPAHESALRSIYTEATGEPGDALDPLTLVMEIMQKSPPGEIGSAKRRIAEERAGLRAPPADPAEGTPLERLLRIGIRAGDAFEQALAREIPADRARAFRLTWGGANMGPGCGAATDRAP